MGSESERALLDRSVSLQASDQATGVLAGRRSFEWAVRFV
jgi:hypothetical protein